MKKLTFLFTFLFAISTFSFADTHIPAGDVSGNWAFVNSPYIIDGEIKIPADYTLTIEPGVQVLFSGHYKFNIYGRLLAQGTETDTIVFTAQDTITGWHSLRFFDTNTNGQDSSKVVYCKLEYGKATGGGYDIYGGAIYCNNSSPILENITITGNSASDGGGIYCRESSPSLTNVTITGNSASSRGGGICCWNNSNPILENVTITGNYANSGGGIYCYYNSNPILENVTITGNSSSSRGGGIYCYESSPSLENVTITANSASYGGGLYCYESSPSFDPVNRCNIFLNYAGGAGNDLYAYNYPTIDVIVDTFTVLQPNDYFAYPIDNFTFDIQNAKVEPVNQDLYVSPIGSNNNSGLTPEEPLLTIYYALAKIIADNTNPHTIYLSNGTYSPSQTGEFFPLNCRSYVSLQGEDEDSTILDGEGIGGILYCKDDNNFSIENLTIQNGNANSGGGIYCYESSPSLENVTITGNYANIGGGIYCISSSPSLENVTITGNSTINDGGGIYCYESSPSLVNVTITGNSASLGGGIFCYFNSNPSLLNCILWNDSPQEIYINSGSATATYSDIQGGWTGTGNIDADPLFADPANGDFHLSWANFPIPDVTKSPCIDAGNPNPIYYDPDGTIADMGAFYYDQGGVGINRIAVSNVNIYPNPSNGIFNISIEGISEKIQVKVFDVNGNNHRYFEINKTGNLSTKQLDLKELTAGVYFISFSGKDFNQVKKIVIQ